VPISDRPVVDAVLAGDRDAYRLLVERESRSVIAMCTSILRDPDEAQDVAQDAFVQAYRSLASYRGDGPFGAWVGRIAARMAVSRAAAMKGRAAPELTVELVDRGPTDESANPERDVVTHEHALAIKRAITGLPPDQRQVVALRFYQDMPLETIAHTLHLPLGTVKSRLHRALARLREQNDLRSVS
jgi:RNA polymerase sigma-70 factor, ECF subfamily